jgi:hypothetical protein
MGIFLKIFNIKSMKTSILCFSGILIVLKTFLFIPVNGNTDPSLRRLSDIPSVSPRNNILYEEVPRDLYFIVHENGHSLVSVERDGEPVAHSLEKFPNRYLPTAKTFILSNDEMIGFGYGLHTLNFLFDDGTNIDVELAIIEEGEGIIHDMSIISFNVDHGSSVLFFLPNGETLMVDTGTRAAAEKYLVPFLKNNLPIDKDGNQKIDYVIISHWHRDHYQGLGVLLEEFNIGKVKYNLLNPPGNDRRSENRESATDPMVFAEHGFPPEHNDLFTVGNIITGIGGDDVEIKILNSADVDTLDEKYRYYKTEYFERWDNVNNRSLSFNLTYSDFVFSFGGDILQHGQRAILNTFPEDVAATDVFHANHHFHGGLIKEHLIALDPYLFLTPANDAIYDRIFFTDIVVGEVIPYLEENSSNYIENLITYETGHTVIRFNKTILTNYPKKFTYETYYTAVDGFENYIVPYLFEKKLCTP